jgi:hypothetical protein
MTDQPRDEPSRYDQLDPIGRALVDDYDVIDLAAMLVKAQDELAALRAVARGYCPECGRGDCAPTVDDWEQQKQRADRAEAELRQHTEADSADAAAGSYAMRAETAERERDEARQHAAAIAAQRDRLRIRMNALADRWDHALAVDKSYARTLRAEISVAPFHGTSTAVQPYRADDGSRKWAARCWGTETCDGWLSLDHDTERWAEIARDRHIAEDHTAPDDADLTAEEARDLADQLSRDLYRAEDRLAFIAELLDAAEGDGTTIVEIARVRGWLDGPKCGMQLAAEEPGLYAKLTDLLSGPLPPPGDTPPSTVLGCSHQQLRQPHDPHPWQPQPGMRHVQCPGYTPVPAATQATEPTKEH